MSKEQQFWDAARAGDLSVVKKLAADTTLNINWQGQLGYTTFNVACEQGRVSVVQSWLTQESMSTNHRTKDPLLSTLLVRMVTIKWFHCSWLT